MKNLDQWFSSIENIILQLLYLARVWVQQDLVYFWHLCTNRLNKLNLTICMSNRNGMELQWCTGKNICIVLMAFWARKDLYSATPAFIQGLGFCGLVWTTTQFSRLVWQARCTEDYSKLSPQEMKKHLIPKHKLIFKGQNFKGLKTIIYITTIHTKLLQSFNKILASWASIFVYR